MSDTAIKLHGFLSVFFSLNNFLEEKMVRIETAMSFSPYEETWAFT